MIAKEREREKSMTVALHPNRHHHDDGARSVALRLVKVHLFCTGAIVSEKYRFFGRVQSSTTSGAIRLTKDC